MPSPYRMNNFDIRRMENGWRPCSSCDVSSTVERSTRSMVRSSSARSFAFRSATIPEEYHVEARGCGRRSVPLQAPYASPDERFEVDANAAASFLRGHRIGERDIEDVWDAIALHTTPGIPKQSGPLSRSSRPASKWTFSVRNMTPSRPNSGKKFALVIQGDTVSRTALSTPSQGERSRSRKLPSVTSRPTCSNYGTRNTNASISARSS
jgi:hypothetical protein